jgi:uncharacterized protein
MLKRDGYSRLSGRLKEPVRLIQVMAGPRQVGKTTAVRQALEESGLPYLFLSADQAGSQNREWIEIQWAKARALAEQHQTKVVLAIDEIQKIEDWSSIVKYYWDEDRQLQRPIHLVLLGSSRLLLQDGLNESLAGRFELMIMSHWSYSEMRELCGWSARQYVYFGAYPGAAHLVENEKRWEEYIRDALIESSISRDILMMTRIDKPSLLRRVFELGCQYSGQIVSLTKILGSLQDKGNTTTLSHYLLFLEQAGLLAGLEKFSPDQARRRAAPPKFQVFNNALMSALSGKGFQEVQDDHALWGRWVESAVGAHLLNKALQGRDELQYWRDGKNEVDFIYTHRKERTAIEVKSQPTHRSPGLEAFVGRYHPEKIVLVGHEGMSWEDYLLT